MTVYGSLHAISAGHHLAAEVGFEVLEDGGNAVDAAIATCITLSVVQSDIVSMGGVIPIIIRLAESGRIIVVSGAGTWPRAASLDFFVRRHGGEIPLGILRTVVPAAPHAWFTVLEHFGTRSFADLAQPAVKLARDGFAMYPLMAENIERWEHRFRLWPSSAKVFLPDGRRPRVGEMFRQPELAATLQHLVDEDRAGSTHGGREMGLNAARRAFYEGEIASLILSFQRENGGLLSAEDLAGFTTTFEEPVAARTLGQTIYTCGPWTQGPMLIQILQMMERFPLASLGHNSADYLNIYTEAVKLAAADREAYYGDPIFVDVPLAELLSPEYAAKRAELIDLKSALLDHPLPGLARGVHEGSPVRTGRGLPVGAPDTSYVCVADRHGNVVSATPSDEAIDCPVTPGTGFLVSSRGSQSWAVSGHPSSVEAGKRPRLTPNPALAVRDDRYFMPFGCPGGDMQVQSMVQAFLNASLFGMDLQKAVEAPRVGTYSIVQSFSPHESYPGLLRVEAGIPDRVANDLATRGHVIERWEDPNYAAGSVCILEADIGTGRLRAAADPRRPARALAR